MMSASSLPKSQQPSHQLKKAGISSINMSRDMTQYGQYSFYEFFHLKKNGLERDQLQSWREVLGRKRGRKKAMHILHINGGSTTATYPPTENYAKTMLALHKPWKHPHDIMSGNIFGDFDMIMRCLKRKKLGTCVQYELAMYEHFAGFQRRAEVTAAPMQTHPEDMSEEDRDMELLTNRAGNVKDCMEEHDGFSFDFGLNFEWDKEPPVVDVSFLFCFLSFLCQ